MVPYRKPQQTGKGLAPQMRTIEAMDSFPYHHDGSGKLKRVSDVDVEVWVYPRLMAGLCKEFSWSIDVYRGIPYCSSIARSPNTCRSLAFIRLFGRNTQIYQNVRVDIDGSTLEAPTE